MASSSYTIVAGDSYWKIANELGIDPIELLRLNGLTMQDVQQGGGALSIGGTIKIPQVQAETGDTGDTEEVILDDDYVAPSDAIADYVGDPAYDAFYAQYTDDVGAAYRSKIQQGTLLQASMQNQLGTLVNPSEDADPYNPALERTGGVLGVAEGRAMDQTYDSFGGRGMGFSGGMKKALGDVGINYGQQRNQAWLGINNQRSSITQGYADRRRQLEMDKLAQESSAYQRKIAEETVSAYG